MVTEITTAATTSVVIATHNQQRCGALAEAVTSVLAQEKPPYEVVVAVDNNTDLFEWVRTQLPNAVPVHNQGARGASATRNAGARVAVGNVLAFLDDDAVARPNWLQNLTAPLARPDVVGVGGHIEPVWLEQAPKWMPEEFLWVVGASYRGLPSWAAPVRNVWSENMAVSRQDFWAIGGFREGFGKTGDRSQPEDTDFCIRLTATLESGTWWYEPSARVGHSVPPDRGTLRFFVRRCYNEGQGKAEISALVGSREGLRDERRHATRTLPDGIRRELQQAIKSREFAAAQRACAICLGLGTAGLGYLTRQVQLRTFPA
jgi:glycosyltransferase involved in cell wall biosynthesis